MAWINLGTINWGSSPSIDCNFQYEKRRNGAAMEYDVWVGVNYSRTSRDFGYPIYCDITIAGANPAKRTYTLKPASPRYWSNRWEQYTGWVSIPSKTSGTTRVDIRLYSGSGSTRDNTYTYYMAVDVAVTEITVIASHPSDPPTLGENVQINLTKHNTDYYDEVTAECGDNVTAYQFIIESLSRGTLFQWQLPMVCAEYAPNNTVVPITFYTGTCTEDDPDTYIGSNSVTINAVIPPSVIPSASLSLSDANGFEQVYGAYVQGKSAIAFAVTPTLAYESPITSHAVSIDGNSYASASGTTPVLQNAGVQTASATVKDGRGRTSNPATQSYNVLAYAQPRLSACTIERCDNDGTPNEEGHNMGVTFSGEVTPLNNVNSAIWAIRYKVAGTNAWTNHPITTLNGVHSVNGHQEVIAVADANAYDVEVTITDDFGTVIAGSGNIPVAYAIMNWRYQGDGMAIGGMNTKAGLQVYMDTEFYGDVDFQGNLTRNGLSLLLADATQYNAEDSGNLTADTTRTKTYTASGDGLVFVSASWSSDGGTWGFHRLDISLNNQYLAVDTETFHQGTSGWFGSNACVFVRVSAGDVIKISGRTNRYQSGNKWYLYTNVLALGCTLTVA